MTAFPKPIPRERRPTWKKAPHSKFCACAKCTRKHARSGSDPGRLEFCRSRECVGLTAFPGHVCRGDVQASHNRHHTGLARKADDRQTVPMCAGLHLDEWERHRGAFEGWTHEQRHVFMLDAIHEVNLLWDKLTEQQRDDWQGRAEIARRRRAEALRGLR